MLPLAYLRGGLVALVLLAGDPVLHGSVLFDRLQLEYRTKGRVELVAGDAAFPVTLTSELVTGRNVSMAEFDLYLHIFRKEFGKYPMELFPLAGLKRIVFCQALTANGQARAAVPDREHGTLYLDVRQGARTELYRRKVIHREFYHLLDTADGAIAGRDLVWVQLNPAGTVYSSGDGALPGDEPGSAVTHPAPGFISRNARLAVGEDMAEVFANLMVHDLKARLLIRDDPILMQKADLLKLQLQGFCFRLDAAFWINAGKF